MVKQLLKMDPASATVPDDEGHTPLMIAADNFYESASEVAELVMHSLQRAEKSCRAFDTASTTPSGAAEPRPTAGALACHLP